MTLNNSTIKSIKYKAENNIKMDTPTTEKQALYDKYQKQYTQTVQQKARNGQSLQSPNAWKNSIYQQTRLNLTPNDKAYYNTDNIMLRQNRDSSEATARFDRLLKQNAGEQLKSAESQFAKLRDQEIANLQNTLDMEVANGNMSIQEAETQFAKQKEMIYAQNYLDSEYSKAQAQGRGIQNSQQFLGMEQTRQANTTSLLNNNMTDRDNKVFQINNRLNMVKSQTARNIGLANNEYNYNMAGATADINAQKSQNQFNMQRDEYNRLQSNQFALDTMGNEQRFQQQQLEQQNKFDLQKLSIQQKYTLQQMAVQQGYDLAKMSKDQQYRLAQMAQQYGYDMGLQINSQQFQAGQNALDRNFQSGQNALDRQHDTDMAYLGNKLQMEYDDYSYNQSLDREYKAWNVSNSKEYLTRTAQEKGAQVSAQAQAVISMLPEIQSAGILKAIDSLPSIGINPTQKQIDSYNKQVRSVNSQLNQMSPELYKYMKIPEYSSGKSTTGGSSKGSFTKTLNNNLHKITSPGVSGAVEAYKKYLETKGNK